MRLSLILAICIVFVGAMAVQADQTGAYPMGSVWGNGAVSAKTADNVALGAFSYDRTPIDSSIDEIDVYIDTLPNDGDQLQLLEGTWSVSTGGMAMVQSYTYTTTSKVGTKITTTTYGSTDWRDFTAALGAANGVANQHGGLLSSGVNFDSATTGGNAGALWYEVPAGMNDDQGVPMYSSMGGSWLTLNDALHVGPGGDMATFYVTTGAQLTFQGHWGNPGTYTEGGWGFENSINMTGGCTTITATPEPSTLFLVVSGLVGLLCYAWRKRR